MNWRIESPVETLVGAAVLAAAAAFGLYAASAGGATVGDGYNLTAKFQNASGVIVGTDVRVAGVKVGRVAAITLDPVTYRADTVLQVQETVKLPIDTLAKIDSEGILGGTFIALEPGAEDLTLSEGDSFTLTQGAPNLLDLISQFGGTGGAEGRN